MRLLVSLVSTLAIAASACAVDDAEPTASIAIPLVQAVGDDIYRLANATFEVTGPDAAVQTIDGNVDAASVTIPVAPGGYTVRLLPGWTLEQLADDGTATTLEALLGNQNPQAVHVFPDTALEVAFRFFVRTSTGSLTISLGVVPAPHQFFGTLSFTQATGVLSPYAGVNLDYVVYFDGAQQSGASGVRTYAATGIAVEFLRDPIGIFAGSIAGQAAGGRLDMTVTAQDGGAVLAGAVTTFTGIPLRFGPAPVAAPLDSDGTPFDVAFSTSGPFTLLTPTSTASGTTSLIHTLD
jgi:hypothetical protein